jgi:hypothetical protein
MRRWLGAAATCAPLISSMSGCGWLVPASCADASDFDPPPRLTCGAALAAARPHVAARTDVVDLQFQYSVCVPNAARCPLTNNDTGSVVAELGDGGYLLVVVEWTRDGVVAQSPTLIAPGLGSDG